ncbi:AIM32 [[Candida] subhashii]|uniref:Altered inheritance of mitochondria protein 32 n=1 Tax=[Candida] subhashii TaxID=561895 RepID=A0A8J5UYG7_9ASCO|nr:AIM32 [[Candida] subhashii]KAG7664310.1 AIM32 [[Candida] subhashii]
MLSIVRRRLYSTSWKLIDHCPQPEYDTGCTHCKPKLPEHLAINTQRDLNNTKAAPYKHVLVLSHGYSSLDTMEPGISKHVGSLAYQIHHLNPDFHDPKYPVQVSNIILPNQEEILHRFNMTEGDNLVYLYPDNKAVKFKKDQLETFVKKYLKHDEIDDDIKYPHLNLDKININLTYDHFYEEAIAKHLVLICAHGLTDRRCGIMGPLIQDEFHHVLRKESIRREVSVGLVSHIGGHAYAGNVVYFPRDCLRNRDMIWYGRVGPKQVQGIVKETIMNRNVIKSLLRGDPELYR